MKLAMLLLLAFQLVIGMQLQAAQPAVRPPTHADCPMHEAAHGTHGSVGRHGSVSTYGADGAQAGGANKHAPSGSHDCCHVSGCQCHGIYTPAAIDLLPLVSTAPSAGLPPLSSAHFIALHIDEFLRPPIA